MNQFYPFLIDRIIDPFISKTQKEVAKLIAQLESFPVLVLCSSTGSQNFHLTSHGVKSIGLDIDWGMVAFAHEKYPNIQFVCGDACNLPFKKGSFSNIVLTYSLHDKTLDLQEQFIQEIKKNIKKNGTFIITDIDNPLAEKSAIQYVITIIIELFSGHFFNGFKFINNGGISTFLRKQNFATIQVRKIIFRNATINIVKISE